MKICRDDKKKGKGKRKGGRERGIVHNDHVKDIRRIRNLAYLLNVERSLSRSFDLLLS